MENNYYISATFEDEYGEKINMSWSEIYVKKSDSYGEIKNLLLDYAARMNLVLIDFDY